MIYSLPYYEVIRKIDVNIQLVEEVERQLTLLEDRVTTVNDTFSLEIIYDVSFKHSKNTYKMLYLHTNRGVFSFVVKEYPGEFIQQMKQKLSAYN